MPKKPTDKRITIAVKDLPRVCFACHKVKDDVQNRQYTTKNYKGPCGDSFCYGSCDLSSCKPVRARVCKTCAETGVEPA